MSDQPLQPFAPPTGVFSALHLPAAIPPSLLAGGVLALVCVYWIVYTVIALYHWMKYSHGAVIAIPAIVVHVVVSGLLLMYALTGALSL